MPTVEEAMKRLEGITGHVAIAIWSREDVIEVATNKGLDCTPEKADDLLDYIDGHQDCELGITWLTLDCAVDEADLPEKSLI